MPRHALISLLLVLSVASASGAAAGLRIEQEVQRLGGPTVDQTIFLAQGSVRSESGDQILIARPGAEEILLLDRAEEVAYTVPLDGFRSVFGIAGLSRDGSGGPALEETGRTRRIGEWEAREVRLVQDLAGLGELRIEAWVTRDVSSSEEAVRGAQEAFLPGLGTALAGIDGFPIETRTVISFAGRESVSTQRVLSIREEEVPGALFHVPEGWKRETLSIETLGAGSMGLGGR